MAGPTPVSALIHAATMVTAGVVMITRVSPLIVHSPYTMTIIPGMSLSEWRRLMIPPSIRRLNTNGTSLNSWESWRMLIALAGTK